LSHVFVLLHGVFVVFFLDVYKRQILKGTMALKEEVSSTDEFGDLVSSSSRKSCKAAFFAEPTSRTHLSRLPLK
ncbi:hypothetical protein, partial [Escherichia coli]|uniref:hypothetical protein n=1 Tax=Escherichia coli TaxID=562 RepID=UPI0022AFAC19